MIVEEFVPDQPFVTLKRYGAKIGTSMATWNWTMSGTEVKNLETRSGMDLGGYVELFDGPAFTLITELHFVQKGTKFTAPLTTTQYPDGTGINLEDSFLLNYLSLGILPKVRLESGLWELYAIAGPRVDLTLSRTVTVDGPEPIKSNSEKAWQTMVDRFQDVQLGATMGVGAQVVELLPFRIGAEARYCPNFLNDYPNSSGSIKGRSLEILLTISTNQ